MKKILLIMLLTFTSMTYADEGRYTMVAESNSGNVWITDSVIGRVKQCWYSDTSFRIICTSWYDLSD